MKYSSFGDEWAAVDLYQPDESRGNLSSKPSQADLHFLRYSSLFIMPPMQEPGIDFSDVNTVEDEFEISSLSGDDGCPVERNQHVSQTNPTH